MHSSIQLVRALIRAYIIHEWMHTTYLCMYVCMYVCMLFLCARPYACLHIGIHEIVHRFCFCICLCVGVYAEGGNLSLSPSLPLLPSLLVFLFVCTRETDR